MRLQSYFIFALRFGITSILTRQKLVLLTAFLRRLAKTLRPLAVSIRLQNHERFYDDACVVEMYAFHN